MIEYTTTKLYTDACLFLSLYMDGCLMRLHEHTGSAQRYYELIKARLIDHDLFPDLPLNLATTLRTAVARWESLSQPLHIEGCDSDHGANEPCKLQPCDTYCAPAADCSACALSNPRAWLVTPEGEQLYGEGTQVRVIDGRAEGLPPGSSEWQSIDATALPAQQDDTQQVYRLIASNGALAAFVPREYR